MRNHFDNGFLSRKHDIGLIKKCDNNKFIIESDVSRACREPLVTDGRLVDC